MKARPLGNTGLELTELGFGGGAIGNLYRPVSREAAMEVMEAAWSGGIRYFDTAPFYGHGLSERRIGDFLRERSAEDFVLSTKVGKLLVPVPRAEVPDHGFVDPLPFGVRFDYGGDAIRRSLDFSLARLGLNRVDILWVHDLEPKSLGADYGHHLAAFLETGLPALEDLKREGSIRAYGLGVNEIRPCLDVLERAPLDALLLAGRYTMLDRSAEGDLLPLCAARGTALVIGGVFNSGILATGPVPGAVFDYGPAPEPVLARVRALETLARQAGITLAQAALRFPFRQPLVSSVLVGTAKSSSLQRNVELLSGTVPEAFWSAADAHVL